MTKLVCCVSIKQGTEGKEGRPAVSDSAGTRAQANATREQETVTEYLQDNATRCIDNTHSTRISCATRKPLLAARRAPLRPYGAD